MARSEMWKGNPVLNASDRPPKMFPPRPDPQPCPLGMTPLGAVYVELRHPCARLPEKQTPGSHGFDLYAAERTWLPDVGVWEYDFGLAVSADPSIMLQVLIRSSVSKWPLVPVPPMGLIDADYRGTLRARFKPIPFTDTPGPNPDGIPDVGDRIAQLIALPRLTVGMAIVEKLEPTARGTGGFGSTGR